MIVCQTYINEMEEKKKKYSIYATGRGVITKVSKVVSYGVIEEKTELVVVMYGEGLGPLGTGA